MTHFNITFSCREQENHMLVVTSIRINFITHRPGVSFLSWFTLRTQTVNYNCKITYEEIFKTIRYGPTLDPGCPGRPSRPSRPVPDPWKRKKTELHKPHHMSYYSFLRLFSFISWFVIFECHSLVNSLVVRVCLQDPDGQ